MAGDLARPLPILCVWDELAVLTEPRAGAGGNQARVVTVYIFDLMRYALKRAGSGARWFHHDLFSTSCGLKTQHTCSPCINTAAECHSRPRQ